MKNATYVLFLAIGLCFFTSCSKDSIDDAGLETAGLSTDLPPLFYTSVEKEVMDLVNQYRAGKGLPELVKLDPISRQASSHNLHMIKSDEVCHDEFGSRYAALVNSIGAEAVSENVAYGYRTADAVVQAWIASEGHRKNLEGDYTHFGISIKKDSEDKLYFTQIFVRK